MSYFIIIKGLKIEGGGGGGGGGKKGSVVHVPTELYNKGCVLNIQDGLKVSVMCGSVDHCLVYGHLLMIHVHRLQNQLGIQ